MSSTNSEDPNQKARLLCVDDDPRFLALFAAVLEAAGYRVVAANDPRQALALAANTGFDHVILDYDMPHMNGAELACHFKQHRCDLPIVLFSGHPSLPAEALNSVDEHAVKGESPELLLQILSRRVCRLTRVSSTSSHESGINRSTILTRAQHRSRASKDHLNRSVDTIVQ
jgi:CheY-like chemotaxis protein